MPKPKSRTARKTTKLQLRLGADEKAILARAAQLRRTTLSKFLLDHAYQAAQHVLAEQVQFRLSPQRWKAFCHALDAPPREIPALQRLLREEGVFNGAGGSAAPL